MAAILKLPVTDDLARVVADYLARPGLSLLGEADAAVEWIADPKRNGFYEIESDAVVYYIHVSPVTGKVLLLATWQNEVVGAGKAS